MIALDIEVTDELEREGTARDLVRLVQQARRDADLDVSDRIALSITGGQRVDRCGRRRTGDGDGRDAVARRSRRRRSTVTSP